MKLLNAINAKMAILFELNVVMNKASDAEATPKELEGLATKNITLVTEILCWVVREALPFLALLLLSLTKTGAFPCASAAVPAARTAHPELAAQAQSAQAECTGREHRHRVHAPLTRSGHQWAFGHLSQLAVGRGRGLLRRGGGGRGRAQGEEETWGGVEERRRRRSAAGGGGGE